MKTIQKIKEHSRVLLLALVILLLTIFLLIFAYNQSEKDNQAQVSSQNLTSTEKMDEVIQEENQAESVEIGTVQGRLMEITKNSITVFDFEKLKEDIELEEIEERMEIYNITVTTPVTKGVDEKVASALHELEAGNTIVVNYDLRTMDVVNINKQ